MKIDQHSVTLTTPARVPAQTHSAQTGSTTSGQTTKAVNPFAALVTSRLPVASSGGGVAVKTPAAPSTTKTTTVTVNPLAGWVTCGPPPANPASSTAATAPAVTEVAPVNPLAGLVTVTPAVSAASTASSTPFALRGRSRGGPRRHGSGAREPARRPSDGYTSGERRQHCEFDALGDACATGDRRVNHRHHERFIPAHLYDSFAIGGKFGRRHGLQLAGLLRFRPDGATTGDAAGRNGGTESAVCFVQCDHHGDQGQFHPVAERPDGECGGSRVLCEVRR